MKSWALNLTCVFLAFVSYSQKENTYLSKPELNQLISRKLSTLVTGNNTGTFISNYASFDPIDGSFSFKGAFPLNRDTTRAQISFLTFKITGDLISQSYTALFNNSVLNTGVSLESQYHFRWKRSVPLERHFSTKEAELQLQKAYLDAVYEKDYQEALQMPEQLKRERAVLEQKNKFTVFELAAKRKAVDSLRQITKTTVLDGTTYPNLKVVTDTLSKLEAEVKTVEKDSVVRKLKIDSINLVLARPQDFVAIKTNALIENHDKYKDSILKAATVTALAFDWWTITAGASKKNYYTYDMKLPFSSQIEEKELPTLKFGIAWNYYKEQSFPKRIFFLNIGVLHYKDNNTAILSTKEIIDEKAVKNDAGDTTRKITKKYNAYTDPIIEQRLWNLYTNLYFLSPGHSSGFHLFPSVELGDESSALTNIGVGYLISFKNEKKDAHVINAEGYVQFNDLFNQQEKKLRFWKRNEIGIRFTFPFSFFN